MATTPPTFNVEIVFKSGAVVKVNVENFTIKKNAFNEVREIEWKNGKDRILRLDIDEIAAVIQR